MGVSNCSMFCCTLLLMGKRELVVLLNLSSRCLVKVEWLFLTVPWDCLWFVIVLFTDHTHLLFLLDIFAAMYVTCCVFLTFCLYFSHILYSSFLKQKAFKPAKEEPGY